MSPENQWLEVGRCISELKMWFETIQVKQIRFRVLEKMFSKVPKGFFLKGHGDRWCHLGMSRQQGFQFRKLPLLRFEDSSFLKHPDLNRIRDGLLKKRTPILPEKSSDIFFHVQMYPERWKFQHLAHIVLRVLRYLISSSSSRINASLITTGHHQVTSSIHAWPVAAPRTWRCAAHEQRKQRQEAAAPLRERPEIQRLATLKNPKRPHNYKMTSVKCHFL